MHKKMVVAAAAASLMSLVLINPSRAQESIDDTAVEEWRALNEEFRQTVVEEMSSARGLDPNNQNPDWLIKSANDISDALRISCDISGACADEDGLSTLGQNLGSFPEYDEEQGLRNAEAIRRIKNGYED